MIWLQHPEHGRKTALMECEAVQDESNGWHRIPPPVGRVTIAEPSTVQELISDIVPDAMLITPKKTWSRRKK